MLGFAFLSPFKAARRLPALPPPPKPPPPTPHLEPKCERVYGHRVFARVRLQHAGQEALREEQACAGGAVGVEAGRKQSAARPGRAASPTQRLPQPSPAM